MAGIQANGIGSGLDINSLVSQLVSAEDAPLQRRIPRHEAAVTTKFSALGTLKGALAAFKGALDAAARPSTRSQSRKATSADTKIFTATAEHRRGCRAATTSKWFNSPRRISLPPRRSSAAAPRAIGYGTLTISVGDEYVRRNDRSGQDATLDDIRDAINSAAGQHRRAGDAAQYRRRCTPGAHRRARRARSNAIKVAASGGDGGLSQLVYDPLRRRYLLHPA